MDTITESGRLAKLRQTAIAAASACGIHGADAEDIAQDTMERWVRTPPETGGVSWAYVTGRNRAVSLIRHRGVAERHLPDLCPPHAPGPAETVLAALERDQVRAAVATLPERQREVIAYRMLGYSESQIAARTGMAPGTVKSHNARARAALRAALKEPR